MKKHHSVLWVWFFAAVILLFVVRVSSVNSKYAELMPEIVHYPAQTPVAFGSNYISKSDIQSEGYSIEVVHSEIQRTDELLEGIGEDFRYLDQFYYKGEDYEYIYLVEVELTYTAGENQKKESVNLQPLKLVGSDYYLDFSEEISPFLNPILEDRTEIALVDSKSFRLILPFLIDTKSAYGMELDYIQRKPPDLLIVQYPQEIYIDL